MRRERGSANVEQTFQRKAEERLLKKYYEDIEEGLQKMGGDNEAIKNKISSYYVSLLRGKQKIREMPK